MRVRGAFYIKLALMPNSTFVALSTTLEKLVCDAVRSISW